MSCDEAHLIERARHFVTAFGVDIADEGVTTAFLAHAMWVLAVEAETKRQQLIAADAAAQHLIGATVGNND